MIEDGEEAQACGSRVLWLFEKRWNVQTFATKLHAFVKVLTPHKVKHELENSGATLKLEAEELALSRRFEEHISDSMKIAIVLSMLPKELQGSLYEKRY